MTETFLYRIQTDPNASENPTATAFFQTKTTVEDEVFLGSLKEVTWPLVSDKTVTVGELTLPYSTVSALVTAIVHQERIDQA